MCHEDDVQLSLLISSFLFSSVWFSVHVAHSKFPPIKTTWISVIIFSQSSNSFFFFSPLFWNLDQSQCRAPRHLAVGNKNKLQSFRQTLARWRQTGALGTNLIESMRNRFVLVAKKKWKKKKKKNTLPSSLAQTFHSPLCTLIQF